MRPSVDEYFMSMARLTAARSTCVRRSVGCVLVDARKHVLATGYNGVATGAAHCNRVGPRLTFPDACPGIDEASGQGLDRCMAVHAEQNAVLQCGDPHAIEVAYVTTFPCPTCTKLLLNTGCRRVVYATTYGDDAGRRLWIAAGRLAVEHDGPPHMIQADIVSLFPDEPDLNRWRVLCACVCLNLCSATVARPVIFRMLHRWPTPKALAGAGDELQAMLRPLGLSERRRAYLTDISARWGKVARLEELKGIGRYALESVDVFCLELLPPANLVGDQKVAAWVEWKRKNSVQSADDAVVLQSHRRVKRGTTVRTHPPRRRPKR